MEKSAVVIFTLTCVKEMTYVSLAASLSREFLLEPTGSISWPDVEELDGGPTPFQTSGSPLDLMGFRACWPKNREGLTDCNYFCSIVGGSTAHAVNFFDGRFFA